ncbi:MAG TPA: hypothetical protein VGG72_28305 [Bryobacteraceae bacterium]|jgi:hypothetical protein
MHKKSAILAGLFAAMCSVLPAQNVTMSATIPFDFRVGDKLIPSGTYQIVTSDTSVILREESGRVLTASFITIPETRGGPPNTGELRFNRYGNEYFLASVWNPYSVRGLSIPKTATQKELAKRASAVVQLATAQVK